ncbi:hypothetical protein Trydic_g16417 [Trypoxylus dichotomus]
MIVHRNVVKREQNFIPANDRILVIPISASPVNTIIIQVYPPPTEHSVEEVQEFYDQIRSTIRKLPKHKVLILIGSFNVKIENVFFDERRNPSYLSTETGPPILVNELKAAIKSLLEGRAPGPDERQMWHVGLSCDKAGHWIASRCQLVWSYSDSGCMLVQLLGLNLYSTYCR